MPYSRVSYVANGTQAEFTVPFPFLRVDTLQVRVNSLLKALGTDYYVDTATSKVVFTPTPAAAAAIDIQRVTPRGANERVVVFTDPSDIRAELLNDSDLQLLYIVQEALDDIASGIGVGDPSGPAGPGDPLPPNVESALDGINAEFSAEILAEANARAAALLAESAARQAAILAEHDERVAALLGETNARQAAILAEQTTRQTATDSLASSISVINSALAHATTGLPAAHARITAESTARSTAIAAEALRITTLESSVSSQGSSLGSINARLTTVESVLSSGEDVEALAFRVTTLETAVNHSTTGLSAAHSRITEESASRSTAIAAEASRITTLEASVNNPSTGLSGLSSRIGTVEGAIAGTSGLSALAFRITTLESQAVTTGNSISTLTASITGESVTRANAVNALAVRMDTVESSVDLAVAQVNSEASTRATADGTLAAEYVLQVTTNGAGQRRVTGFRVTNLGGAGGGTEFVVQADRFVVVNASGDNARIPFQVVGGVVYIDEASIQTLAASKITGGTITGRNFTLATNGGTGQQTVIQSANYVPGSAGFVLRSDGYFECSNGVFRGQVVLGSNTIPAGNVSGLGSLAVQNGVSVGQVSGLGALATQSSVAYNSLTGTKPPENADVTLAALNGDLVVTSGGLTLTGGRIRSGNYVAGTSGWIINSDGAVEFHSGTFRGGLMIANPANNGTPGFNNTDTGLSVESHSAALFISRADVFGMSLNRNGGDGAVAVFRKNGTQVGAIQVTGSATSYLTFSDRRLKQSILDADEVGEIIDRIQVRDYEFVSEPGRRRLGFIAQELHEVVPDAVAVGETEADPWSVDYSKLVPLLVREVQSLRARLNLLDNRLT